MFSRLARLAAAAFVIALLATPAASVAAPSARITNGKAVSRATFDARWGFVVSVQYNGPAPKPSDREMHSCGGSLIAPDLVLTAEHCTPAHVRVQTLASLKLQVLANRRSLRAGAVTKQDRVDVVDVWHYASGASDPFGAPTADVAILKLARPIDAPVIQLVGSGERATWGGGEGLTSGAMVAGWGLTAWNRDDLADSEVDSDHDQLQTELELREVSIPLRSDRTCESSNSKMYLDALEYDRATMLCGGSLDTKRGPDSNRRGACNGDSGGPLIVPDGAGGWRLAGVVSWGPSSAGGCNSYSVFARVDAMRDWIEKTIAANGPARPATAPATLTATPRGVNALRISWTPAPGAATPKHVALFREFSWAESLVDLDGEDIDLKEVPRSLRPEVAAIKRMRSNMLLGGGGPETRSLVAYGVAPRRAGQVKKVRLRLVTEDAMGQLDVSPDVVVDAPVDAMPPARPKAPRNIGTQRGAVKLWWPKVRDNDCVHRYMIQVRRPGTAKWRGRDGRSASACPQLDALVSGYREGPFGQRFRGIMARLYGRANDFRMTRMTAGAWDVRIVAIDRAGNRSIGPATRVVVPKLITAAADTVDDEAFSEMLNEIFGGDDDEGETKADVIVNRRGAGANVALLAGS